MNGPTLGCWKTLSSARRRSSSGVSAPGSSTPPSSGFGAVEWCAAIGIIGRRQSGSASLKRNGSLCWLYVQPVNTLENPRISFWPYVGIGSPRPFSRCDPSWFSS
jgi:hypothetical protein